MATNEEVMILFKGVDNVSPVADKIKRNVTGIGDSASGITGKIKGIASSFDFVSSAITGVLGGMTLLDQATKMWNASTQRQTSEFYLGANIGTAKAKEMTKAIQDIVSQVPGDDTFMNMILSGSLAKQTDMTTEQLSKQANVVADYLAGSEMQGKNAIEAQQDMKSYILSGSTAELERSSILSNQIDKLKDKKTIQERINALAEAEAAEKVAGLSGYDTAANALTEFQGQMEKAYADMGEMFLPIEQSILQGFLDINDSVGGGLATAIVGVGTALSTVATGIGAIGSTFTGLNSIITFFSSLKEVLFATEAAETALAGATTVSTTATEAQTSVTSLLAASQFEASLAEAGLTEAEAANMAATYGVTGALGAQEVATASLDASTITAIASQTGLTEAQISGAIANADYAGVMVTTTGATEVATGGFMALAGSIWATVWPVLAVVAAVAVIAVAFEQLGEYMGWWTDFGSMIDSVKAGILRLWDAFKNSRIVQKAIEVIKLAFGALQQAAQPVLEWLGSVWNELFNGGGAGSGGPDAIGAIIDAFTVLEDVVLTVGGAIFNFWSTVFTILQPVFSIIKAIGTVIFNMFSGNTGFIEGIVNIAQLIATLEKYILAVMINIGKHILEGIGNALKQLIPFVAQIIVQLATSFIQWQISLGQKARQIGLSILNGIISFVRTIPNRIVSFLLMMVTYVKVFQIRLGMEARRIGLLILNGIINFVRTIPTRVANFFKQIPGKIRAAASAAISAASNFASNIVNTVKNGLAGLVDSVYQEFMNIPGKIRGAISSAVSAATAFGSGIKDAVLSALHIASPGIIQRKIAIEFADIPGRISESNMAVHSAAQDYATNIIDGVNSIPKIIPNTAAGNMVNNTHESKDTTIINLNMSEGAVQLDARNFTTQESKQIVINALEGLKNYNLSNGGVMNK